MLEEFESNASMVYRLLDYIELQNKTLQLRFVGILSLPPHFL